MGIRLPGKAETLTTKNTTADRVDDIPKPSNLNPVDHSSDEPSDGGRAPASLSNIPDHVMDQAIKQSDPTFAKPTNPSGIPQLDKHTAVEPTGCVWVQLSPESKLVSNSISALADCHRKRIINI